MAQITITQLDDALVARLRKRAAASGRSMAQEVRAILAAACADQTEVVARLRQRHAAYGGRIFSDSADIVREMRDQRTR
jgi:plasmid stability protein